MKFEEYGKLLLSGVQKSLKRQPLNSSVEIRLTRLCTQRCMQCQVYERTTDPASMSLERFQSIAERLRAYGAYIGFISGGEPTMVPQLDKILLEAKRTFLLSTTLVSGLYNKTKTIENVGRIALENDIHIQTSLDGLGPLGDKLRGAKDFSKTVLGHMQWLSENRGASKSLLYANIVMNNLNLEQIPKLVQRISDLNWKVTIGLYHALTSTTRKNDELQIRPGKRLDSVLAFLDNNPSILNLNSFIRGIKNFIETGQSDICAFTDAPTLTTRTTIMEDGSVHLCWGDPIGNVLKEPLGEIFSSQKYRERINEYRSCSGCWTTCYTQRYLLTHPRSLKALMHNLKKVRTLRR